MLKFVEVREKCNQEESSNFVSRIAENYERVSHFCSYSGELCMVSNGWILTLISLTVSLNRSCDHFLLLSENLNLTCV